MAARRQEAGWKAASPAGRRAPSTKTQKTEGGEDENAFLGLAGEGVTVDLGACVCVCGGGCVRPWRGPGLPAPSDAGPGRGGDGGGERAGGGGHPRSRVRYLKLALWSPSPPPPPGLWLLVVRVPPGLEGRPSALYFLRRDHLLTALSFRLNRTRGSPSPLPFPW